MRSRYIGILLDYCTCAEVIMYAKKTDWIHLYLCHEWLYNCNLKVQKTATLPNIRNIFIRFIQLYVFSGKTYLPVWYVLESQLPARFVPSAHVQQSSKVPMCLLRMRRSHFSHHINNSSRLHCTGSAGLFCFHGAMLIKWPKKNRKLYNAQGNQKENIKEYHKYWLYLYLLINCEYSKDRSLFYNCKKN